MTVCGNFFRSSRRGGSCITKKSDGFPYSSFREGGSVSGAWLTGFNTGAILTLLRIEFHGLVHLEIFYILSLVAYFVIHRTDLANTTLHSRILEHHMQITPTYYFQQYSRAREGRVRILLPSQSRNY